MEGGEYRLRCGIYETQETLVKWETACCIASWKGEKTLKRGSVNGPGKNLCSQSLHQKVRPWPRPQCTSCPDPHLFFYPRCYSTISARCEDRQFQHFLRASRPQIRLELMCEESAENVFGSGFRWAKIQEKMASDSRLFGWSCFQSGWCTRQPWASGQESPPFPASPSPSPTASKTNTLHDDQSRTCMLAVLCFREIKGLT